MIFNDLGHEIWRNPRYKDTQCWRNTFLAEATTWDSCISVKPNKIARTEWDNLVLYCVSKRPVAPRVNRTVDGGKDERQLNKSSNCSYERPVRL